MIPHRPAPGVETPGYYTVTPSGSQRQAAVFYLRTLKGSPCNSQGFQPLAGLAGLDRITYLSVNTTAAGLLRNLYFATNSFGVNVS